MDIPLPRKRRAPVYAYAGLAVLGTGGLFVGMGQLREAPPSVARAAVWIDTVQRGELVRDVSGPGRLATEDVRLVSARSAGRVEVIHHKAGAAVDASTVVLELSNPELEQEALEAGAAVKHAEAELLDVRASLEIQIVDERGILESLRAQHAQASRQARAEQDLVAQHLTAANSVTDALEHEAELAARVRFEEEHLRVLQSAWKARVAAKAAELARLHAQAQLRERQVADLQVRAGTRGVLQEMPLEVGQQVELGMQLAKVVDPSRLKAELRIPEARAKEIALEQRASIDIQHELVPGRVVHVDPAVQDGSVRVDVALEAVLPQGARPDLSIEGRIEIERLHDVLYVGKPASGGASSTGALFKLSPGGRIAQRVTVRFGRASVSSIEVQNGLVAGDRVILSDMSEWERHPRIELE